MEDYVPPTKLHKLAVLAQAEFERTGGFSTSYLEDLTKSLKALYGDINELADAAVSLTAVMAYCEEEANAPSAAEAMKKVIESLKPRFEAYRDEQMQGKAEQAKGKMERLSGVADEAKKKAPTFGAQRPKGVVPMSDLLPKGTIGAPPRKR